MENKGKYISQVRVRKMWGRVNLQWNNVNEDVNILVGINGCGKTTLLNLIYDCCNGTKIKKDIAEEVSCTDIESPVKYIRSFDVPANARKKTESMLLQELKHIVNQNGEGTSFFDYRMKMLNYPQKAAVIQERIEKFFALVNSLFEETGKEIAIDRQNNTLTFHLKGSEGYIMMGNGTRIMAENGSFLMTEGINIKLDQLSSGEKQMLLILTTVFLQEEKPNQRQKFFLNQEDVQQYFPKHYTPQQMQQVILHLKIPVAGFKHGNLSLKLFLRNVRGVY